MQTKFEIPFRTIRIGSMKSFPAAISNSNLKFTKYSMKFKVVLEHKRNEPIKFVIPTSGIQLLEGYVSRGCPVIWVTTDVQTARRIRKLCGMQSSSHPTPYFDPESKELANRRLSIIPADDPISNKQMSKFRTIVRIIATERKVDWDSVFLELSRMECNDQLMKCTKYISDLTQVQARMKIKQEAEKDPNSPLYVKSESLHELQNANTSEAIVISSDDDDDITKNSDISLSEKENSPIHTNSAEIAISEISGSSEHLITPSPDIADFDGDKRPETPNSNINEADERSDIKVSSIESKRKYATSSSNQESEIKRRREDNIGNSISSVDFSSENISKNTSMFSSNSLQNEMITPEPNNGSVVDKVSNLPSSKITYKTVRGTASLSADMQTLYHDMESMLGATPLCICVVKSQYVLNPSHHKITCMAIDNIDGRLTGCMNNVSEPYMMRASKNLPAHGLCSEHRARMLQHECCPGCGTFCAGGTFLVCNSTPQHQHRFHRNCLVLMRHSMDCPHCGCPMSNVQEVSVNPSADFLKKYEEEQSEIIEKSPEKLKQSCYPNCVIRIPGITKPFPEFMLFQDNTKLMPDRENLDILIQSLETDLPKKLRFQAKNLIQLVKQGDAVKVLQLLCGTGGNPNARNSSNQRTALHEAVARDSLEIVHLLVTAGADVNVHDEDGKTPLFYAEQQNRLDIVKYLITCNTSLVHSDSEGMVPLHHAAKNGRLESCLTLMKYGSKNQINCLDEGGWTPLVWAAEHKRTSTAQCLMYYNANMHTVDQEGNICLQWAALAGNKKILLMCLKKNCNIDHQNILGDTALHIAAREDNRECVVLLLAWGANPRIKNNEGRFPAQCAKEPSLCQVALLMNAATRNAITDHKGFEPLDRERLLSADISRGKENIAISCINAVDEAPCPVSPPHEFLYISKNIYKYTNVNAIMPTMTSCKCTQDCTSCECGKQSGQCWYDASGRLLPSFNFKNPPFIYECNPLCKCSRSCRNRVIQNGGVRFRIQVFRTPNIGWGVRALEPIPRGSFVCEYIGEVIADGDARDDDFYLFDLDNKPGGSYCIDGRSYGNVSRYLNHHCEPNLVPVRFFFDHQDSNFPRIAFFAMKDIAVGEQLCFDYGSGFWDEKCENFTCECGATKCRFSEKAYRKKRKEMDDI
uniref:histone-lysine N-methyltransferase EHMT1-like n=1 Tax=Styela clava TaxID=7725 RepID=UPI00193AC736|nr:histone-lysine N-methyltransferase EHMT1-like [Styela clava]